MTESDEKDYYRYLQLKQKAGQSTTATPDSSYSVPKPLQTAAQAITMPGRGFRGLGVGAEQMLLHPTQPQSALAQAAQAVQPGFQAGPGQKLGQFAGGFGDPLNIAANAVMPGGTLVKSALSGLLTGGGASALDQASQGKIQPKAVGTDALMSGATAGLLHNMASIPKSFLGMAPEWLEKTSNIPKNYTKYFMNHPGVEEGRFPADVLESDVRARSEGAQRALQKEIGAAKGNWEKTATELKLNKTSEEMAKAGRMSPGQIADSVVNLRRVIPAIAKLKPDSPAVKDTLKTLLSIRGHMGEHIKPQPGVTPAAREAVKGLTQLRQEVNEMIASLPGGQKLRDADTVKAATMQMSEKLDGLKGRPGEALQFIRNTFEGKGPNAIEDMTNLVALDKFLTDHGRPSIVEPLYAALTRQSFAPALAGNQISRAIAGASPFLISAMLRVVGLPFQVSLPLSAAAISSARSPRLQGQAIRFAQEQGPKLEKAAGPAFMTALNLIRQRRQNADTTAQ